MRHLTWADGDCCSCVERDRKFTFKKSDVPSQHLEKLQPGAEVMFTVLPDGPDNDTVISVAVLPSGTLPAEQVSPGKSLWSLDRDLCSLLELYLVLSLPPLQVQQRF